MKALLLLLALFSVAWGGYLVVLEFARYRKDRRKLPPLTPEEAAADRWHKGAVILIATLSIMGALLAWRASATFGAASDLAQRALQERVQLGQQQSLQDEQIDFSTRLSVV